MELPFLWCLSLHCDLALAMHFGLDEATLENTEIFLSYSTFSFFLTHLCASLGFRFYQHQLLMHQLQAKINRWMAFDENPIKTLSLGLMILMSWWSL